MSSTINECRISLLFSKLLIANLNLQNCLIHLKYEDKQYRFPYPQLSPFTINFHQPFTKNLNTIYLTILISSGKKFRVLAKGPIHIYKKYFYSNNLSFEKWIYLSLSKAQLDQMTFNTDIITAELNGGQIYLEASLLDPLPRGVNAKVESNTDTALLREASKSISPEKEKISQNKSEKFRSIVEGNNAFLKKLKSGKLSNNNSSMNSFEKETDKKFFKDDLSDISLSEIDSDDNVNEAKVNEYIHHTDNAKECDKVIGKLPTNITAMLMSEDNLMSKVKELNFNDKFPQSTEHQKHIYTLMNEEMPKITQQYIDNINRLNSFNMNLRHKAKEFYKEYALEKEKFALERKSMHQNNKKLKQEIESNKTQNKHLQEKILKNKISNEITKKKLLDDYNEINDINTMIDILNTLKFFNVDITKELNKEEKERLNNILKRRNNILFDLDDRKEEGDLIVAAIEEIVNRNFNIGLISKVKIEQVDINTYFFDEVKVVLKLERGALKTEEGEEFEIWLLRNFKVMMSSDK